MFRASRNLSRMEKMSFWQGPFPSLLMSFFRLSAFEVGTPD